mgnify:CR=1 FL=1
MIKKVSIITINYNGLKDTVEMIESLAIHETYLHEIIIIDNASTDPLEHKLLQSKFPDIQVIRSEKNIGFAGGNNLGISQAKGEYLLFLNNDTIITCPILENLVNALDSDPQIGAVSPKITCWPEKQRLQYAGSTPMSPVTLRNSNIGHGQIDQGQFNKSGETAFTHGAAMMIRTTDLTKFGRMPEFYFLYYEELDWCTSMTRAGYQLWYEPRCTIFHKESQSTGRQSPLRTFYDAKPNALRLAQPPGNGTLLGYRLPNADRSSQRQPVLRPERRAQAGKSRLARSEGFLEAVLSDSPPQITQISTQRNHFFGDIHKRESEILWNSLRFYRIL